MAKNFDSKNKALAKSRWQDYFKPSSQKEWTIDHNKKTDRIELRRDGEFVYSTMNPDVCKNYASIYYDVPLDKWR